jgi:uncharacterized protein YdbL (DUF1318 family)
MKPMIAIAAASVALLCAAPVFAQEKKAPEAPQQKPDPRAELKERMKQRAAVLERLRTEQKVGETFAGLVEVVKSSYGSEKADSKDPKSGTVSTVVDAENSDRRALFELIAKETNVSAAEVGKQNGIRSLERASDQQWLKLEDGRWVQKKDVKPAKK